MPECDHMTGLGDVQPTADGCEDCLKLGDEWVNLRLCLVRGYVGCCNDSKNRHAAAHFQTSEHPVIQSLKPGETWRWCYVDEVFMDE